MNYADGRIETPHETDVCEIEYVRVCMWEGMWVLGLLWNEPEYVSSNTTMFR